MAGQNILVAASISPQVIVSQQLGASDTTVYSVPAGKSVKVATASIANVTSNTAAPVLTLGTTSTTGGTFAAGTYYWKVTAKNSAGETLASNEVTATTTGSTSSQPLSWTAPAGATSYNVYRGTAAGAENTLVANVITTSYTDTGTAGTTAVVPTASTYGYPVTVSLSLVPTGGTVGDGTHRILNNYSLAANDTFSLNGLLSGAMLGPGDIIAGFASTATGVDLVVTGTVHA